MSGTGTNWTNRSVLKLAGSENPISAIEQLARRTALQAMDKGWSGPPFDPLRLAEILGLQVEPRADIPDARTVPLPGGRLKIEFNPLRPRARVRFSIAHEVAHSLFPDCAARIRNRGGTHSNKADADDWQLEVLCNIGAAELLMPLGSFPDLSESELTIDRIASVRKEFDVSIEALAIRLTKLATGQCAAFCASRPTGSRRYHVDYFIPSSSWGTKVRHGFAIPENSVVSQVNAIGYTAKGVETWIADVQMRVECIGLAPYPGTTTPRVVGIAVPTIIGDAKLSPLTEVQGDALDPRGDGPKIVAHVVPDSSTAWGGGGFAAALRKRFPEAWQHFRDQVHSSDSGLRLGKGYRGHLTPDTYVFHMVAQHGVGPSITPRIRYAALEGCLAQLKRWATQLNASVHMPRIGSGHAGGNWQVIKEMILAEVADEATPTIIYTLPQRS